MTINLAQQIIAAERATGVSDVDTARLVAGEPRFSLRRLTSQVLRSSAQLGLRFADRLDPELELAA